MQVISYETVLKSGEWEIPTLQLSTSRASLNRKIFNNREGGGSPPSPLYGTATKNFEMQFR